MTMLTDPIRDYLRSQANTALLFDVANELCNRFDLTPEQAGDVLAAWVNEVVPGKPRRAQTQD